METAVRKKVDLVLIQEPPEDHRFTHPGYDYLWTTGRVMSARCKTSAWTFSTEDNLTKGSTGDVQVLSVGRRNQKGRVLRIANVYSAKVFGERGGDRPAHLANWPEILSEDTVLAGDFNAHSPRWNPHNPPRRNHHFLEELMDDYDLIVQNDGTATRHPDRHGNSDDEYLDDEEDLDSDDDVTDGATAAVSIIDLTLASPRIAHRVLDWQVLEDDDDATGSDHVTIAWSFDGEAQEMDQEYLMRGWSLTNLQGNSEEVRDARREAGREWVGRLADRPRLHDDSPRAELEDEAVRVQEATVAVLNGHAKKITLCARSKRWWNEEIAQRRRELGRAKRRWRARKGTRREVREAKRIWQKAIREAKRRTWEEFLQNAKDDEVWSVIRYTKPNKVTSVPTITDSRGNVADTHEAKSDMLARMAFPPPVEYDGGSGEAGPEGEAFGYVTDDAVRQAIYSMSGKKAPGPDGLGASVLRLMWEWDSQRITALVRASIRLGAHPNTWKVAKGVTIPKPGKDDYTRAKSYRVISLLNCLGKVVEKVVATMISDHCEREGTFHPGQYGSRKQRSAVDAVGVLMASVQESWSRGRVCGALCMDVEAAFPSVAKECLAKKMRAMRIDECLVRWMLDFMADRRVRMVVDGQEGDEMAVSTGLPQGSPVSPILFAIYMADIHQAVESRVTGARGISFVDDITWLVEADDIPRLVR
jgi:hypothetical protein